MTLQEGFKLFQAYRDNRLWNYFMEGNHRPMSKSGDLVTGVKQ